MHNFYVVIFEISQLHKKKEESANMKMIMYKHMSEHILDRELSYFFLPLRVCTSIIFTAL